MTLLHAKVALRLRIVHDGNRYLLPVSSAVMSWAVNEIPICNVQIPLGIAMSDPELPLSVSREVLGVLNENAVVQVLSIIEGDYASPRDGDSGNAKWDSTARVIFDGRINHISDSRTIGSAALNISIRHWLSDLTTSSILMSYASPMNVVGAPSMINTYGASPYGAENVFGSATAGIGTLADAANLTRSGIGDDLWSGGIKQLIADLLTNPLERVAAKLGCESDINKADEALISAWQRLEGPSVKLGSPYSKWTGPLTIGLNGAPPPQAVLASIADFVTRDSIEGYLATDAWTKLTRGLGTHLHFVVIPRVSTAMIVPYLPALRTPYCHRITANAIASVDTVNPVRVPLRAVGVFAKGNPPYGNAALGVGDLPFNAACHVADPPVQAGRTRFVDPPKWLGRIVANTVEPHSDFRAGSTRGGVNNPGADFDTASAAARDDVLLNTHKMLQEYARMKYANERLHGRNAKVAGKLRFDISPGSTVEVTGRPEQFRGLANNSPNIQGYVSRVTISIDAARKFAMTLFQLQHVRTLEENGKDDITLEQHPLYTTPFYGAPLLDAYENEEC